MNQEFKQFMEISCLALARLVPEFPTHMGLFKVDGEDIPQNEFTRIDEGAVLHKPAALVDQVLHALVEEAQEDIAVSIVVEVGEEGAMHVVHAEADSL